MDSPVLRWSFLALVAVGVAGTVALHLARLPTGARGYYNRGVEDNRRGNYDSALANFGRALEIEPTRSDAHVARAVTWCALDRPFSALEDADEAIAAAPNSSRAYYVRAMAQRAIGREDVAIRDFEHAFQLDPAFARAAMGAAGVLLDAGRYDEAAAAASAATEAIREDYDAHDAPLLAWAARLLGGDAEGAEAQLSSRAGSHPSVSVWMAAVRALASGDRVEALARFREVAAAEGAPEWVRIRARAGAENIVFGFRVERVNREISDSLSFGRGLRVTCVRKRGPAAEAGLALGDRLVRIDGAEATEEGIGKIVREAPLSVEIPFEALRGEETRTGTIRPASSAPTR
ncbi:MAG TPA: PDZ domain-containing protein [Candidatus Polarisedimenticolaceae bacterium]|nr:PDZ domain-containing protein [Candidatus Polarisedimenticolaceae bacterium]